MIWQSFASFNSVINLTSIKAFNESVSIINKQIINVDEKRYKIEKDIGYASLNTYN